ncbi:hypothetical protein K2P97_02075 [bacterium]|nr:hypothetical protein [bacterium]
MATWLYATLICFFVSVSTYAQDLNLDESLGAGEVIVEKAEDYTKPYKERRGTHGALFSVGMEKFYPVDYRSLFNDVHIENIVQEKRVNMVNVELGYKFNLSSLGSIAVVGVYGAGGIDGSVSGLDRNLAFTKYGLSANFALDAILNEPWVVPYLQGGVHQYMVSESAVVSGAEENRSGTAGLAGNYKFGLLFQLDWLENSIDKTARAERIRSSGLENTYIDVYMTEYLASSAAIDPASTLGTEGDPNLHSSAELGVALKLEF